MSNATASFPLQKMAQPVNTVARPGYGHLFIHSFTSGFSFHGIETFTFLIQPGLLSFMPLPFTLGECPSCTASYPQSVG